MANVVEAVPTYDTFEEYKKHAFATYVRPGHEGKAMNVLERYLASQGTFLSFVPGSILYARAFSTNIGKEMQDFLSSARTMSRQSAPLGLEHVVEKAYTLPVEPMQTAFVFAHELGYYNVASPSKKLEKEDEVHQWKEEDQRRVVELLHYLEHAKSRDINGQRAGQVALFYFRDFPNQHTLAVREIEQGKYKEARTRVEKLRADHLLDDWNVDGTLSTLLAVTYLKEGKPKNAQPFLENGVKEQFPGAENPAEFYTALARLYYGQKDYERLKKTFDEGMKQCGSSGQLVVYKREVVNDMYEFGRKAQKKGDESDARKYFRRIIELHPRHAKAHLRMAESYHAAGRTADARTFYERTLAIDATLKEAREGLARL